MYLKQAVSMIEGIIDQLEVSKYIHTDMTDVCLIVLDVDVPHLLI
jgi:hypothetical protein